MPTRREIQDEILGVKATSQDDVRRKYLGLLHSYTGRDTIVYATASSKRLPNLPPPFVMIVPEDIQGFMAALHGLKGKALDLMLHSNGGQLEGADQIVQYLRSKYDDIRAIVPQNAMSAATMLACACDRIVMGKHSAIGPIDPQMTFPYQQALHSSPAQALLDEFEQAKAETAADPKTIPLWATKIQSYPPGLLRSCQVQIDLSQAKVAEWLEKYMFRGGADAAKTAGEIAAWLGDANIHKTHGRPIMLEEAKRHGLVIEALEDDQNLQERVLSLFHAVSITLEITPCTKFVENHEGKGWFLNVGVEVRQP